MVEYPEPEPIIVSDVTVPATPIFATIEAPNPTVDAIVTIGASLYPFPNPVKNIFSITPNCDTDTVADAPTNGKYPNPVFIPTTVIFPASGTPLINLIVFSPGVSIV